MDEITITKNELTAALGRWYEQGEAEGWAERRDDERNGDAADYLIACILEAR